jgi:hypothetical protein
MRNPTNQNDLDVQVLDAMVDAHHAGAPLTPAQLSERLGAREEAVLEVLQAMERGAPMPGAVDCFATSERFVVVLDARPLGDRLVDVVRAEHVKGVYSTIGQLAIMLRATEEERRC